MIDYLRVTKILWRICSEVVAYCEQVGTIRVQIAFFAISFFVLIECSGGVVVQNAGLEIFTYFLRKMMIYMVFSEKEY